MKPVAEWQKSTTFSSWNELIQGVHVVQNLVLFDLKFSLTTYFSPLMKFVFLTLDINFFNSCCCDSRLELALEM